jgi:glycosyltransferase involved in cell wall biosynthesis
VPLDLAVLGQDPRFGGGGVALTDAFLTASREAGRDPVLLYEPHPGLEPRRLTWRRVEAVRQLAAARRLELPAREARSLWIAASLAQHGAAAPRSRRAYGCFVATTIRAEWHGRAAGLPRGRRLAAAASIPLLERLERRILGDAAALYATSAASCADVAAVAGRAERDVRLLRLPIDAEQFTPATDHAWQTALAGPVLVFVGRADDPRKNLPLLLEAFAELRRRRPEARLLLVGRPPGQPPPAGVEALGTVPDVAGALRRAALLVLPSRQEGFGIVAAEALAAGLPVVSTPCGGPEELIRESGGGIVLDGFDPEELAAAILALAEDRERAAAMRTAGRTYVIDVHAPSRFRRHVATALRELDGN